MWKTCYFNYCMIPYHLVSRMSWISYWSPESGKSTTNNHSTTAKVVEQPTNNTESSSIHPRSFKIIYLFFYCIFPCSHCVKLFKLQSPSLQFKLKLLFSLYKSCLFLVVPYFCLRNFLCWLLFFLSFSRLFHHHYVHSAA